MSTLRADTILPYTSGSQITIAGWSNNPASPAPCANDYVNIRSYSNWVQGMTVFGTGGDVDKFTALAQDNDPGDYLTLELTAGQVNGINISTCPSYSITLTAADITYRDDGYGSFPTNYIDFINGVFASHSLYTTFSGSNNYYDRPNNLVANYCKVDNFCFTFRETGQLTPSGISVPMYYAFKSEGGAIVRDTFNNTERLANGDLYIGNVWLLA